MNRFTLLICFICCLSFLEGSGQPDIATMDIKKPAKYENRELGAEKTATKKNTLVRRFMQDNITHYNFYFNANNKITEVLMRAKGQYADDYTKLLTFYNYSLEQTARDKRELDSVIYKCTTGILIHDLRNDWIDNLYLLIGKAYYFRNLLDSAHITFQFVNYAYSPKEKGGYDKPIGSNANADEGGSSMIISTKEKRNIIQKVFTLPPSRNEAFIWLTKTYLARDEIAEAAGMIQTLKNDPQFPPRLFADLNEVQALWFYKQQLYDSSAAYLEKALVNATNREDLTRWEYLIAQMYERAGKPEPAKAFYQKVFSSTFNPVMEVYARLNYIRQDKGNDEAIQRNIDALVKMAKKDRYESYRDIIYYTAALIELERNNKAGAELLLLKCVKNAQPNSTQKNKAFLLLGDLSFDQKKYKPAKNYYDSVNVNDQLAVEDPAAFTDRKKALDRIVMQLDIVDRQDSLQKIAAMSKADREDFIKKLVKKIRKQQGLDEDEQSGQRNYQNGTAPSALFGNTSGTTDWYFNNNTLKVKGYTDFKAKWGNRQNTDNWQLASLSQNQLRNNLNGRAADPDNAPTAVAAPAQVTFAALIARVPLTPDKMKISNDSIEHALPLLGKAYQEGLPDYAAAIAAYEKLLAAFPETVTREENLFNLYYCYKKIGDENNAARILALLKTRYASGKFGSRLLAGPNAEKEANAPKTAATKQYEHIYNSFIEGRFDEALAEKKSADSMFGKKYWTPQLLYIESVYFIKQRSDTLAKADLNTIIKDNAGTPIASKAKNLLDVLSRRKEIEDYLTKLKVVRAGDDSDLTVNNQPVTRGASQQDSARPSPPKIIEDTSQAVRAKIRTNPLAIGQQQRSDSLRFAQQKIKADAAQAVKIKTDSTQLVRLRMEADSLQAAMLKIKSDSAKLALMKRRSDSLQNAMAKIRSDSAQLARTPPHMRSAFAYNPDQPHSVIIFMNKVDPVYVTETRNAFNRYNHESYAGKPIVINNTSYNDTTKMVVISGFENAAAAIDYMEKGRKLSPREIVPWLPVGKYYFLIATDDNLGILQANKDLPGYMKFLLNYFPGKF